MRIVSWNVNGLRACAKKGFLEWLEAAEAEVVGLQETRVHAEQLDPALRSPGRWRTAFASAERPGYSGVGLYSQRAPDAVETSLGDEAFDIEGRVQMARFGKLLLVNAYFPNGNGKNRDNSRIPYKLAFYQRLYEMLEAEKHAGGHILVMGDFNTCHKEIDIARPKENQKTSGFRPEERAELDRWVAGGWTDTFRAFESGEGHYSWWSQRFGVRARNIGWRIDYVFASPGALPFVKHAFIHPHIMGSDHCPVGVDLDPAICG